MPVGFRRTAFITLNTATFAPIPRARVITAAKVNPGDLNSWRSAYRSSCMNGLLNQKSMWKDGWCKLNSKQSDRNFNGLRRSKAEMVFDLTGTCSKANSEERSGNQRSDLTLRAIAHQCRPARRKSSGGGQRSHAARTWRA